MVTTDSYVVNSTGSIQIKRPDGAPFSCGWAGIAFESEDRGDGVHVAEVPLEAVGELVGSHGFDAAAPMITKEVKGSSEADKSAAERGTRPAETPSGRGASSEPAKSVKV